MILKIAKRLLEKIEEEFTTAYEAARQFLDSQKEKSSEASEILSTDLLLLHCEHGYCKKLNFRQ